MPRGSHMFAGPTLHRGLAVGLPLDLDGLALHPPAKRGDIERLLDREPGVIVLVDGYFHLHALAVGHAELRMALERGWDVWGLSSMGAIRAAEMRPLGMQGFGVVYRRYVDDPRFRDDEVALLHEPEPPFRTFSEPLVHIRALLDAMVVEDALTAERRAEILGALSAMWFGDRTLAALTELGVPMDEWRLRLDDFQLKSIDLAEFLRVRPWRRSW